MAVFFCLLTSFFIHGIVYVQGIDSPPWCRSNRPLQSWGGYFLLAYVRLFGDVHRLFFLCKKDALLGVGK